MAAAQITDLPLTIAPAQCRGRTFIVTGANTGLGYEAVRHLVANSAARIVMAVRSIAAGEKAKNEILSSLAQQQQQQQQPTTEIQVWPLDLSSYASISAFAAKASTELDRVDVVIQNAGVAAASGTAEGHKLNITVNVLGTLLLGVLLLPKMSETARKTVAETTRPHLSFVASSSGFGSGSEAVWDKVKDSPVAGLDALENSLAVYPASKNLLIQTVRYFAAQVAPLDRAGGVVVNVLNPGLCETSLDRNAPPEVRAVIAAEREAHGRTAEQGSRTLLHGGLAGVASHGRFLDDCEVNDERLPTWLLNDDGQKSWEAVREELEKASPGCTQALANL